jgi:hypothetical protein
VADSPIKFQDSDFKKWQGSRGTVRWKRATFEQLPATFHVVNGMADLQIVEYVSAEMVEFSGPPASPCRPTRSASSSQRANSPAI